MVYKILFTILISSTLLFGVSKEAKEIKAHYNSLAKDFVIYQFLKKKSTTKADARYLYNDVYRMTNRLKKAFYKKIGDKKLIYSSYCKKSKNKKSKKRCSNIGVSPKKFEKMSKKSRKRLYKKLKKRHRKSQLFWLRAMMAKDTFKTLSRGDGYSYLRVFNSVSYRYKHKVLDKKLSSRFLTHLANQKKFTKFVMHVVMDGKYKKLPASLLRVSPKRKKLSFNSAFYLGLLALKNNQTKKALTFFKRAKKETKRKSYINKVQFWEYQATKNNKILQTLAHGTDLNFYTLYAKEKLNLRNFELVSPKPRQNKKAGFDISDPFLWAKTMDKAKKLTVKKQEENANRFYTKETLPHYTFLKEIASGYTKYYFITPYENFLKGVDKKRKALIYSIARQESRFVPAAVSTSYALGMMQFMPFLARATAKDEKIENFKYFDMFKPEVALRFADIHLDYLENRVHEPLFIAYAYNGGIGFTRGLFKKRGLFKSGKYEPFMSMELVHYTESREYGKKVITNYAQYAKLYNLDIKLSDLYKNLISTKISLSEKNKK